MRAVALPQSPSAAVADMPAPAPPPPGASPAGLRPTVPGAGPPPLMALPRSSNPPAAGDAALEPAVQRAREAATVRVFLAYMKALSQLFQVCCFSNFP